MKTDVFHIRFASSTELRSSSSQYRWNLSAAKRGIVGSWPWCVTHVEVVIGCTLGRWTVEQHGFIVNVFWFKERKTKMSVQNWQMSCAKQRSSLTRTDKKKIAIAYWQIRTYNVFMGNLNVLHIFRTTILVVIVLFNSVLHIMS